MAKRYGMNTPDVLRRRQNIADQQAAAYQARLMPNPGTPAWEMGLETSTPFFDIATVGMGGGMNLLRKGIARKLAEARLRRQPAYTSPNTTGQQFRAYDPRADEYLDYGDDVVRRGVSDDMARWADDDAIPFAGTRTRAGGEYLPERIPRRRGYPNRAANIAEKRYERSVDEMVSGPTSKKAIRKIQVERELERRAHQKQLQEQAEEVSRRGLIARRRRMQGSMGDDL